MAKTPCKARDTPPSRTEMRKRAVESYVASIKRSVYRPWAKACPSALSLAAAYSSKYGAIAAQETLVVRIRKDEAEIAAAEKSSEPPSQAPSDGVSDSVA